LQNIQQVLTLINFINILYLIIRMAGGDTHDLSYYLKCMMGGALACGLTHTAIVPLDVAKCKKQIDPTFSKGMVDGISKVVGAGNTTLGWAPTFVGYSLQGLGKFGFYEMFKDVYKKIVG
jgi:solute carrier family 25 phosphate transporter 3